MVISATDKKQAEIYREKQKQNIQIKKLKKQIIKKQKNKNRKSEKQKSFFIGNIFLNSGKSKNACAFRNA